MTAGRLSRHAEPLLPLPLRVTGPRNKAARPPAGGAPALPLPGRPRPGAEAGPGAKGQQCGSAMGGAGSVSASRVCSLLRVGRVFSSGTGDSGLKASENCHNRRFQLVLYWCLNKERFYFHRFLATERYCTTYSVSSQDVK